MPSLSRRVHFQVDGMWLQLPDLELPGVATPREGEGAALLGVRAGFAIVSKGNRRRWGLHVADELALGGHVGARFAGDPSGRLALHGSGSYALALAYRTARAGALFVGLRPTAAALLLGGSHAYYATIPVFAQLEFPLGVGAVALEAHGYSVAGVPRWGASLHLASKQERYGSKLGKYLTLRLDRTTTELDVDIPATMTTPESSMAVPDANVLTFSVLFGVGFDK